MAKCDPPVFESAGPHFNPDGKQHGLQNPQGPHAGDMSNFTVAANGMVKTIVVNPHVTLTTGSNSVFAGGGTALVVHAKADDMKSDPAGNAGDRIQDGDGRKLIGVITDRDITCRAVAEGRNPLELTAQDCMSKPVVTVTPDAMLEDCCHTMERNQIRRVPVVDERGACCGVVSQADIARVASEARAGQVLREVSRQTSAPSRVRA